MELIIFLCLQYRKYGAIWSHGRHFRVERIDSKRTTFDCGVKANFMQESRSSARDGNPEVGMLDYCGTIQDIIKVGFRKFEMFIFDVKWFKVVTQGAQVTVRKDKSGFLQVDRTKIWTDQRDTFVLPEHCEQVIFKEDPTDRRWLFVIQFDPRGKQMFEDMRIADAENELPVLEQVQQPEEPVQQVEEQEENIIVEELRQNDDIEGILLDELQQPALSETNIEDNLDEEDIEDEYDGSLRLMLEGDEDEDMDELRHSTTATREQAISRIDENEEIFLEIDLFGAMDLVADDQLDDEF